MITRRTPSLLLAGCQALVLGGALLVPVEVPEAAGLSPGADEVPPPPYAQEEYAPGQGPGGHRTGPGGYGMGYGGRPGYGMVLPQGPGGYGSGPEQQAGGARMEPVQRPGGYGMGYGQGPGYGMAPLEGPHASGKRMDQGPAGYGMAQSPAAGTQAPGPGFGGPGHAMPPGGQRPGMMAGAMEGPGSAMLRAVGAIDMTDEQRSQYKAINEQLQVRQKELMDKLRAEGEKMRKLQEEQMSVRRTLSDLQGHLMQATLDAANRAEELLTDEQRQAMIDQGRHVMTRPGRMTGQSRAEPE